MSTARDLPVMHFDTADAWAAWLDEHHATAAGICLEIAKKGAAAKTVNYADALDIALCYGWIDGRKNKLDDDYWIQRFTPRRAASRWSQRNRARAVELMACGRMQAAGLREVERAQSDGRWDAAYAGQSTAEVPDDLRRALSKDKLAKGHFAALDSRNRYAILYRIQDAKRPETRARRVEQFVAMLHDGKTIH